MAKIGVIGCGYWGIRHVRNFRDIPQATMAMVSDLSHERCDKVKEVFPGISVTNNYQELLDSSIDGVVIATPPGTHYSIAKDALLKGKHVLVEKPLTTSSAQASELIELAEKQNKVLMVGHTYSYNPAVDYLKNLITKGDMGQIYYIDSARLNLGLFQQDVNVLWDLAPHDISIILYLLQMEPHSVSARGAAHVDSKNHDIAYMEMRFPGDVVSNVHVSWLDPCKVRRLTVVGSKKMAVFDDSFDTEKIRIYDKGVSFPSSSDSVCAWPVTYRNGDVTIPHIPTPEPLNLECTHFVECIDQGKKCKSDGWSGLRVVSILEAAQKSLLNGGLRLSLDPVLSR